MTEPIEVGSIPVDEQAATAGAKVDEPVDRAVLDKFKAIKVGDKAIKIDDLKSKREPQVFAADLDLDPTGETFDKIGSVWKQGFPISADPAKVVGDAIKAARDSGITAKLLGTPEIMASDEHVKAGEILVKLVFAVEEGTRS